MSLELDRTLERINRQTEERNAMALAAGMGLSHEALDDFPFTLPVLELIPIEVAEKKRYATYVRTANKVRVAVVDPQQPGLLEELREVSRKYKVKLEAVIVSETSFTALLRAYARLKKEAAEEAARAAVQARTSAIRHASTNLEDLRGIAERISTTSVTDIIDDILATAYEQDASDIHIEPTEQQVRLRFRIDGVLQEVALLPKEVHHALISRIKVIAGIKLDLTTAAQDGRFSLKDRGVPVDIRVSVIPTGNGEGVVMRLLRQDAKSATLVDLGFSEEQLTTIHTALKKPYGVILVTGPTGSGKSTTLYAMLQELNSPERKILTLEDPIEYRIPGVEQSQIDADHNFGFAEGLRALLRQDPDVIMVGEIRDPETATTALNAGLTGHLVLATLHTNDAVGAYVRLLELGVEPYLLSGSVQLVIGQRLVRRKVGGTSEAPEYKGREVIAELLTPSTAFETAVTSRQDLASLQRLAREAGLIPMLEHGMQKAASGITTESEIQRVTA